MPAPPPPRTVEQTTKTTTIRNHVNVKKNSLTLHPSPTDPNKLGVNFTFDANIECWVSVFFVGSENPQKVGRIRLTPCCSGVDRARSQRLKPKSAEPLSNFASNFNLRRYKKGCEVLQIRANGSAPPPPAPPRTHHTQGLGRAVQVEPMKHTY